MKVRSSTDALLVAALLLLPAGEALAQECSLTFSIPEGFLDLSPGAPPENFQQAPEGFAEIARSPFFQAFAVRRSRYGDVDVFSAAVRKGVIGMNRWLVERMANQVTQTVTSPDDAEGPSNFVRRD